MPLKRLMIRYIRLNRNELGTPKPSRALAALSATRGGLRLSLAFFRYACYRANDGALPGTRQKLRRGAELLGGMGMVKEEKVEFGLVGKELAGSWQGAEVVGGDCRAFGTL